MIFPVPRPPAKYMTGRSFHMSHSPSRKALRRWVTCPNVALRAVFGMREVVGVSSASTKMEAPSSMKQDGTTAMNHSSHGRRWSLWDGHSVADLPVVVTFDGEWWGVGGQNQTLSLFDNSWMAGAMPFDVYCHGNSAVRMDGTGYGHGMWPDEFHNKQNYYLTRYGERR